MRILVALPTLGQPHARCIVKVFNAMTQAAADCRASSHLEVLSDANATVARNRFVSMLLEKPDFTHLFFVDDDTLIPIDAISRLAALDCDIATGLTPFLYYEDRQLVVNAIEKDSDGKWLKPWPTGGPFDISTCGTSCLLIRRRVFEEMEFPWFQYYQRRDGECSSEDTPFVFRAIASGFTGRCDPEVRCGHMKTVDLKLFADRLAASEAVGVTAP